MKHRWCRVGTMAVLCLLCAWGNAQEEVAATVMPNAPLEFILPPVQKGFSCYPNRESRAFDVVFRQEPVYLGETVYRNALSLGEDKTDFIGVAYDVAAQKMYIDRNRNLDLTDDGPGIDAEETSRYGYARFPRVRIELSHGGVLVPYIIEMYFYNDFFNPWVQSGWQGEIELHGKNCLLGIGDNLSGVFDGRDRFRFDHEKNRQARLAWGSVDLLPLPQWFHFDGQNYRIECAFRIVDDETALAVTLHPITEDLMDVTIDGEFISRLMLDDFNRNYGLLDWPVHEMRIPRGEYALYRVDLLDSFSGYPRNARMITPGGNAQIKVGGPVKQEITATRSGSVLSLDYSLLGVGDIKYSADSSYSNRATFAVYQGDRKVEGGDFEYG